MSDWKQITARIRRARGSKDPGGQLSLLYEKTRDAMVAFELGRHFEVSKDSEQAVRWYNVAISRFRRKEWKTKAQDAIVRLGGEVSAEALAAEAAPNGDSAPPIAISEPGVPFEQNATAFESIVAVGSETPPSAPKPEADADEERPKRGRRRGRRGGRNRRKSAAGDAAPAAQPSRTLRQQPESAPHIEPPRTSHARSIPSVPVEPLPESGVTGLKGRFGDPGLSSRLTLMEMHLRRLLTCPAVPLGDAASAPAGPGVFVLTDDDLTTYYYVEACDTLRVAIGVLARSGSSKRGNINLKSLLGDHLGISETRVSKYLADHCVVRWLQLDEGAVFFSHFAIAVLRPLLNE